MAALNVGGVAWTASSSGVVVWARPKTWTRELGLVESVETGC